MTKKILSVFLCLFLLALMPICVFAANAKITVDTVSAKEGETVEIGVNIENNPGIAAITIDFTYDSKILEYQSFKKGFLTDYTLNAIPIENKISFVNLESSDVSTNGNMLTLIFKVKKGITADKTEVGINYSKGDFCNYDLVNFSPEIVSGGVIFSQGECEHKNLQEFKTIQEPTCTEKGLKNRKCDDCAKEWQQEIAELGHSYEQKWTVDIKATKERKGQMSRHCIRCDEVCDIKNFSIDNAKEYEFENNKNANIKPNDFTGSAQNESFDKTVSSQEQKNKNEKAKHYVLIICIAVITALILAVALIIRHYKIKGGKRDETQ